jgi:hypothetical protein
MGGGMLLWNCVVSTTSIQKKKKINLESTFCCIQIKCARFLSPKSSQTLIQLDDYLTIILCLPGNAQNVTHFNNDIVLMPSLIHSYTNTTYMYTDNDQEKSKKL